MAGADDLLFGELDPPVGCEDTLTPSAQSRTDTHDVVKATVAAAISAVSGAGEQSAISTSSTPAAANGVTNWQTHTEASTSSCAEAGSSQPSAHAQPVDTTRHVDGAAASSSSPGSAGSPHPVAAARGPDVPGSTHHRPAQRTAVVGDSQSSDQADTAGCCAGEITNGLPHNGIASSDAGLRVNMLPPIRTTAAPAVRTAESTAPSTPQLHGTSTSASPDDLDLSRRLSLVSSPGGAFTSGAPPPHDAWRCHKRHFFVLNSAGKPVFTLHGDEVALAGFTAVIQAVVSVVQDQGDAIRQLQFGSTVVVFLVRGHLYLMAASSAGEPPAALRRQLQLLYNHIILLVTTNVERVLQRNPAYDVRQLLGGSCGMLRGLIKSFSSSPAYLLEAHEPLPMPAVDRRVTAEALAAAVADTGALYGVLAAGSQLAALERGGSPPLHPLDVLLLTNFLASNESLRYGETFSPVCLPHFREDAPLHAYIYCLEQELRLFMVLLSGTSRSFYDLSAGRAALETTLRDAGVLQRLRDGLAQPGSGRVRVATLPKPAGGPPGTTPLWHFIIKFPQRAQCLMGSWAEPFAERRQQRQLVRAYARLLTAVHGAWDRSGGSSASSASTSTAAAGSTGSNTSSSSGFQHVSNGTPRSHRIHIVSTDRWIMAHYGDREYELSVVLDPLTTKELCAKICDHLRRHFLERVRQAELLLQ